MCTCYVYLCAIIHVYRCVYIPGMRVILYVYMFSLYSTMYLAHGISLINIISLCLEPKEEASDCSHRAPMELGSKETIEIIFEIKQFSKALAGFAQ